MLQEKTEVGSGEEAWSCPSQVFPVKCPVQSKMEWVWLQLRRLTCKNDLLKTRVEEVNWKKWRTNLGIINEEDPGSCEITKLHSHENTEQQGMVIFDSNSLNICTYQEICNFIILS